MSFLKEYVYSLENINRIYESNIKKILDLKEELRKIDFMLINVFYNIKTDDNYLPSMTEVRTRQRRHWKRSLSEN